MTIAGAALVVGVDEGTFRNWETGRSQPLYPRSKALIAAFINLS